MHPRRLRPVAALTLALLAAPFLAATAVATTRSGAGSAAPTVEAAPSRSSALPIRLVATTQATVQRAVETITLAAAVTVTPPAPVAPAPPLRAVSTAPPPPPAVADRSTWVWPANGPITSPFGARWGRMHEGVDIDAAYGSAVVAGHRGTVIAAGWGQSGYGRVVHIDHGNGLITTYNHLASVTVAVGQFVERGVRVGTVGASGSVTAAHLHYEVRVNGAAVNPAPWLPRGGASAAGNPG
jgi:murein DD-endopeptidase MepM/ murein hydrolase activator NlpD